MKYVDFDIIKKHFEFFWNHEYFGRCAIRITAPKGPSKAPEYSSYEDIVKAWTDGETRLKQNRIDSENTYYLGEAYPLIPVYLGAAGHAGFFNNIRHQFAETVWFFPIDEKEELRFSKDSFLYKSTVNLAKYLADNSSDEFILSMPDCCGNLDALAHLRGSEQLMIDMLEDPGKVKAELKLIQHAWEEIIRDTYDAIKDNNHGGSCIGWMGSWARGLHSQMQSDISVMLSPGQFSEFVLGELEAQSQILEYPCYHLDGREQLRHLDKLLKIKNLKMIQYTFVEGQPSPVEQLEALKKIQQSGMLLLVIIRPEYVKPLLENLSAKGLFINTACKNPEEADRIFKIVQDYSKEQA
ncbi:hypothetical protein [Leadbettera azotonutricia]|uniref:Trimethylamine corrinoid protein 2 n=1 Tax=Leadbettera azotonutricia (strain ATCC BAA-888 / DSM 13862 / ZAS-9) TaxID=545695 RepID=F5Y6S6_LEAAZ|nr:hypothetical protein [Leadbettera azotonutricia]AEF83203.1 hypothetical protein TREAZ_1193 [Leadbettera azotonutricia ZAS-9]